MTRLKIEVSAVYLTAGEGGRLAVRTKNGFQLKPIDDQKLKRIRAKEMQVAAQRYHIRKYKILHQPDVPLRDPKTSRPTRNAKLFRKAGIWNITKIEKALIQFAQLALDPVKETTSDGMYSSDDAKMTGITPAWFTFSGM